MPNSQIAKGVVKNGLQIERATFNRGTVVRRREAEEAEKKVEAPKERIEDYLSVDVLGVEIGYGLIPIVDETQGGDFLDRVTTLRRQIAQHDRNGVDQAKILQGIERF